MFIGQDFAQVFNGNGSLRGNGAYRYVELLRDFICFQPVKIGQLKDLAALFRQPLHLFIHSVDDIRFYQSSFNTFLIGNIIHQGPVLLFALLVPLPLL